MMLLDSIKDVQIELGFLHQHAIVFTNLVNITHDYYMLPNIFKDDQTKNEDCMECLDNDNVRRIATIYTN